MCVCVCAAWNSFWKEENEKLSCLRRWPKVYAKTAFVGTSKYYRSDKKAALFDPNYQFEANEYWIRFRVCRKRSIITLPHTHAHKHESKRWNGSSWRRAFHPRLHERKEEMRKKKKKKKNAVQVNIVYNFSNEPRIDRVCHFPFFLSVCQSIQTWVSERASDSGPCPHCLHCRAYTHTQTQHTLGVI